MTRYTIPPQIIDGFKSIIKLNSNELDILSKIIETAKIGQGIKSISEENSNKIPSLNELEFKLALGALFSMVTIFAESKGNIEQFTSDFSESYKEDCVEATNEEKDKLKVSLTKVLPFFHSVKLTYKAKELLSENHNNILEARIISDIRIVFDDKKEKKEQCAIIIHNLKIKYFSEFEKEAFFVSLDLADLKKLQKVIDRAIEKDSSIRSNNHLLEFIDLT